MFPRNGYAGSPLSEKGYIPGNRLLALGILGKVGKEMAFLDSTSIH